MKQAKSIVLDGGTYVLMQSAQNDVLGDTIANCLVSRLDGPNGKNVLKCTSDVEHRTIMSV
jgi:hypothetical protein